MSRQSRFEEFLRKFPEVKRKEVESLVMTAPTTRQAFDEVRKIYKYRGGYSTILTWRNSHRSVSESQASEVEGASTVVDASTNPIQDVQSLHRRINVYCNRVLNLLEAHEWVEQGEVRLGQRQAEKLLAALPPLAKTATSGLVEMSRLQLTQSQKAFAIGVLYEFGEDWRRTLEHDNPELISIFESVLAITMSRLELDTPTVLDEMLNGNS